MNVATPSASVTALDVTEMRFLSSLLTVAVTVSPSTGQSFSPVNVTETSLLCFLLSVSLRGDTVIDSASHTNGVGLADGVGNGDNVGTTVGIGVGVTVVATEAVSVAILRDPVVLISSK